MVNYTASFKLGSDWFEADQFIPNSTAEIGRFITWLGNSIGKLNSLGKFITWRGNSIEKFITWPGNSTLNFTRKTNIARCARYRFFKWNLTWNSRVRLWIFHESHGLLFKWKKTPFHLRLCECCSIQRALEGNHISPESCILGQDREKLEFHFQIDLCLFLASWTAKMVLKVTFSNPQ